MNLFVRISDEAIADLRELADLAGLSQNRTVEGLIALAIGRSHPYAATVKHALNLRKRIRENR